MKKGYYLGIHVTGENPENSNYTSKLYPRTALILFRNSFFSKPSALMPVHVRTPSSGKIKLELELVFCNEKDSLTVIKYSEKKH